MRYIAYGLAGQSPLKMKSDDGIHNDVFKIVLTEFDVHVKKPDEWKHCQKYCKYSVI